MNRFLTWVLLMLACICNARPVEAWGYERLLEEADLVVIARPTISNKTETIEELPNTYFGPKPVQCKVTLTTFSVSALLKGNVRNQTLITFRHLREPEGLTIREGIVVYQIDGPGFVEFKESESIDFLLFLRKLPSGEFVAVSGQVDPYLSVRSLESPPSAEIEAEQAGAGQPATRPESKSEASDKPQPEAEGRSR